MSADLSKHDAHPPRIGRYRVLSRVATGGMAAVYRAHDVVERRDVALKVLSPHWVAKPVILQRFLREARLAKLLEHENIVAYFDSGQDGEFHFHAMEYVSGLDLKQYVGNRGRLDIGESRYFVMQAARALEHLYDHGIVHRDIKPSNFIITLKENQQLLKLIDFGLARRLGEDSLVAKPGTTVGTVDYIAPEQAEDRTAADVRSDIYALGCTWYFTLTGKPPFIAGTAGEKLALRMETDAPDIREANPEVPLDVVEVLNRMMARNQSFRYQSPTDLLHDLETLTVSGPVPGPRKRSGVAAPSPKASLGWLVFAGLAVIVLVAAALFWLLR